MLYLGGRQLRVHTSKRVDMYVHASSHPLLEHCTALRLAPYPPLPDRLSGAYEQVGLDASHNQWHLVDDFDWLRASHSPNWAELPPEQRAHPKALDASPEAAPHSEVSLT